MFVFSPDVIHQLTNSEAYQTTDSSEVLQAKVPLRLLEVRFSLPSCFLRLAYWMCCEELLSQLVAR